MSNILEGLLKKAMSMARLRTKTEKVIVAFQESVDTSARIEFFRKKEAPVFL